MSLNVQSRIQRTYRVALVPFTADGAPITVEVNLSYPLDDEVREPNHVLAKSEAIERLRRLAKQGRATSTDGQAVTVANVDECDWDVKVVRQTLVTVELDENGKPVRKSR